MFALHETTQRRVCRGIFLVACVLPVLLTLAVVVYWNRPWRELDWQRSLAEQLHVRATLSEISTPRPGVTSLTNLNLADLRTGNPLGSIGTLTCQHENARLTLRADRLEIQADQLPALAVAVSTWLATSEPETLDLHVDSFTIVSPELNTLQLENLSISSNEDKGHQYFQLKALNTSGEAVQMTLECPGNSLRCVLDTGHASLPSWVLADWVPGASGYGNAKFSGVVSATHEDRQPRGLLRGQFSGVNLQE